MGKPATVNAECDALAAMLERVVDAWADPHDESKWKSGDIPQDLAHDADYARTCSLEEPQGCLFCEARALLATVKREATPTTEEG